MDRRGYGVRRRIAVVIATVATVALGTGLAGASAARGATANRAAVVVEVDGVIHTAKVTFSTDSISGLDALRDAGFAPSVRVFGGNGGAVCALDVGGTTIGCPADNTCLTCSAASDYWAYWRALAGETKYTYSPAGASTTQVRDGDVEAWNWSTGSAPSPFVSFTDVWGSTPTTTRAPVTTARRPPPPSPSPVGTEGSVTPSPPIAPATTAVGAHGSAPTTASAPSTTKSKSKSRSTVTTDRPTETSSLRATNDGGKSRRLATAPVVAHGGGGSSWGLIGFAAILVVLLAAIVVARRRRRAAPAAS